MSIENDYLWIFSDDKKWCISRTSLIEMFEHTPIFLSIMGFNYESEEEITCKGLIKNSSFSPFSFGKTI